MQPLRKNGLSVYYIDESVSDGIFVTSAIRIPLISASAEGPSLVWEDFLKAATEWRRGLSKNCHIRARPELHARELVSGHGRLHRDGRNLTFIEAKATYVSALQSLNFLPANAIATTYATNKSTLFWAKGIEATLIGLFQRIRRDCDTNGHNGMILFDDGHKEYIEFYRRAVRFLPTGSMMGAWDDGAATKNLALDMFAKDANIKDSRLSPFLQIADLVSYAALTRLKYESGKLSTKRTRLGHHELYDAIPIDRINIRVTQRRTDGLCPI